MILVSVTLSAPAQDRVFYAGFFPEAALSHSVSDQFQVTFKVESQHGSYDERLSEGDRWEYFHDRTDLQGFVAYRLHPLWKVSVGYQYRLEGGDGINSHRSIQQVAYTQKLLRSRLGHRLRTDQTYQPEEATEVRLRYRLSMELPLSGQSVDPGEFYAIFSNELIGSYQADEGEIENRLVGSLGRYLSARAKLEAGLDYRTDGYIAEGFRQRLWLKVGGYFSL